MAVVDSALPRIHCSFDGVSIPCGQKHVQEEAFLSIPTSAGELQTLVDNLSPQNCLDIRRFSIEHASSQLTKSCDAFIGANLSKMLNEENLVSLPRVQVNVDVSEQLEELDSRSLAYDVLERIVDSVVQELLQHSAACPTPCQFVEEKLVVMQLMSDLSVQMADSKLAKSGNHSPPVSPRKSLSISLVQKQPSPFRRLQLGEEKMCNNKESMWEVLNIHTDGTGAMAVVRCVSELLILNVQMVSKGPSPNVICLISPTTGVPLAVSDSFFSQMILSRCGFGVASLGDSLMSVGGFGRGGVFQNCEVFDSHSNSWVQSCKLATPRARLAVVQHEDQIYAIGGSDGKAELNSVEVFSNESKAWKKMPSVLCTARSDFGATVLDGRIYAVGGMHYSSLLRSAEVFDPVEGQWKPIAFMSTPRRGAAVVSCIDSVYAIGGQAFSWGCLNSVECYNPITNQWRKVAPMSMPRRNACAVAVEDRIYVIGGFNGSSAVDAVEVYDPASNKWSSTSSTSLKRSSAAAVQLGGAIYVIGGFSGSLFLNSVEQYDIHSCQWSSFNRL